MFIKNKKNTAGYTLVEVIVSVAVFLVIATAVYDGYVSLLRMITSTRLKTAAIALANEQLEIAHNLPYDSIGLVDGMPAGILPRFATSTRDGVPFSVRLSIQDIDDLFDGQIGGTPNDLAPNDYKRVEVEISCLTCKNFQPFIASTFIAPKNLENNTGNGALFVKVIDADGLPIPETNVHIVLASTTKTVDISETTNSVGVFQLVNTYPADLAYKISVSKTGYSSARTYAIGEAGIVNPVQPNATVVAGQVTQVTLAIDRLAKVNIKTMNPVCQAIGSVPIVWRGTKILGTDPDVFKIDSTIYTDSSGLKNIVDAEWDTYTLIPNMSGYALAGSLPLQSLAVAPGSSNDVSMILVPAIPRGLLVSVKDAATGLPLANSDVHLSGGSFDDTMTTNRGFWSQTDWSGGEGQILWSDISQYASSSDIDIINPVGDLKLVKTGSDYAPSGWLESSVFNTGSENTSYYQIGWLPLNQPASAGYGDVRLQLAVNNDPATTTWNFTGPDGTADTFYTATTTAISSTLNNYQYIRYKIFLQTLDLAVTPVISDMRLTYSSECLPFGQVYFDGLPSGTYNLSVGRTGYQTDTQTFDLNSNWQSKEIQLSPQ
ncbi:MAG: prepilin-type N-terminal cleavage/methylation domain-containing protein [Candidatus Paceibacterota bacterium]|jgi:prepilin-type N-terminal cleavage/methylation domain-containing protein